MKEKKSNEANIERKKSIFFYVGLLVALAITLIAFEWSYKQYETGESEPIKDLPDEIVEGGDIRVLEKEIPDKPEPYRLVRKQEKEETQKIDRTKEEHPSDKRERTTFSSIDPNQINLEDIPEELFHFEDFEGPIIDPLAGTIEKSVTSIDQRPYFPECCEGAYSPLCYNCTRDKLFAFIRKNIEVPECVHTAGGVQIVWVKLTIDVDGTVNSVEVINMDEICTEAVVRTRDALSKLPPMVPGTYAGVPVRVSYHIPVKLRFM